MLVPYFCRWRPLDDGDRDLEIFWISSVAWCSADTLVRVHENAHNIWKSCSDGHCYEKIATIAKIQLDLQSGPEKRQNMITIVLVIWQIMSDCCDCFDTITVIRDVHRCVVDRARLGDRLFAVVGPRIRNMLPASLLWLIIIQEDSYTQCIRPTSMNCQLNDDRLIVVTWWRVPLNVSTWRSPPLVYDALSTMHIDTSLCNEPKMNIVCCP